MSIRDIPIQAPIKRKRGRPSKSATNVPIEHKSLSKTDVDTVTNLLKVSGALFDTLDYNVYRQRLDSWSLNELTNEAFRVGLKGGHDRLQTTRAILEVFIDYKNKTAPSYINPQVSDGLTEEKRIRALELMRDGK